MSKRTSLLVFLVNVEINAGINVHIVRVFWEKII